MNKFSVQFYYSKYGVICMTVIFLFMAIMGISIVNSSLMLGESYYVTKTVITRFIPLLLMISLYFIDLYQYYFKERVVQWIKPILITVVLITVIL